MVALSGLDAADPSRGLAVQYFADYAFVGGELHLEVMCTHHSLCQVQSWTSQNGIVSHVNIYHRELDMETLEWPLLRFQFHGEKDSIFGDYPLLLGETGEGRTHRPDVAGVHANLSQSIQSNEVHMGTKVYQGLPEKDLFDLGSHDEWVVMRVYNIFPQVGIGEGDDASEKEKYWCFSTDGRRVNAPRMPLACTGRISDKTLPSRDDVNHSHGRLSFRCMGTTGVSLRGSLLLGFSPT